MKPLLATITCNTISLTGAHGAALIIDSFDQNPVNLSITRSQQSDESDIGYFTTSRHISLVIAGRVAALGSVVTATIDPATPGFSFFVDGLPNFPQNNIDVSVQYGREKRISFSGYEAFEFEILSLSGSGNLVVDTGTLNPTGPDVTIIELQRIGVIRVPFMDVNFDPNQPNLIGFAFQATSEQFSVKLGEFRAVPEPSSSALFAAALISLASLRRRVRISR
jgi:hypothetical protein